MAHDVGITYGGTAESCTKLSAWVDADFTTYPDTRRSVSGTAVMLRGAISWFSRVQKMTAAASSESKYVCDAGRSCKRAPFPSIGEGLLDAADRRQHCNQGG